MTTPNPGSPEAVRLGCQCPVIDNGHGRGYMGGAVDPETGETLFVMTVGCPLHGYLPTHEGDEPPAEEVRS